MSAVPIQINKVHPDAKIPTKRQEDGCFDIYPCFDKEEWEIKPHTTSLVPTGIRTHFGYKYRIQLRERGSNTKSTLILQAGVIDSGYLGEWFVALYNGNESSVFISKNVDDYKHTKNGIFIPYEKAIAQAAVEISPNAEFIECNNDEFDQIKTERGTGKLGSSGK